MKNGLLVVIINIVASLCLSSQSRTFEITPDFYINNNNFATKEIKYTPPEEALEFIGLSCYHFDNEDVAIFYRTKTDNHWSPWMKFDRQHEFVEPGRSAYQSKPIQKLFSVIQFMTSEKLQTPLTIRFFLANQDKKRDQIMERSFTCDIPEICNRICWCPTCPIDNTPEFTEPTHLIVHHSAGNNQSNNFATVVKYIWDLHVNTNGWDDIGYNWLIDPNGFLYEGRPDNYQGAHFSCINQNTVGICVIGDYTLVQPSQAALSTLVNLLAFEATDHAIDINGQSYHVTGDFFLDNLAGHRDSKGSPFACSATVCPGDSFYPLLEEIRHQISGLSCYNNVSSSANENNNQDIKVFPNPVHHQLFIESDKHQFLSFEIIDIQGASLGFVHSGKANDLSHLTPGVYFLISNGELLEKIIKR
jgi:hypothetical protein